MKPQTELFANIGVCVNDDEINVLSRYIEMLLRENEKQNLTALHSENDIWGRHILDAAMLTKFIPEGTKTVIDIGTGGGVPGIPLAILRPDLRVVLLDSELRKIEFCRSVIEALSLNAEAVAGRAEELSHDTAFRGQFDLAVSRAMASGTMLCELGIPMLRRGGTLLGMKGRGFDPAVERFSEACAVLGAEVAETVSYTICGEPKYLIRCVKNTDTESQYPRRFAKIKRSPL